MCILSLTAIKGDPGKPAKPGYNVKMPPFSSGHWKRCCPRTSKTVLGTRAMLYVPRTVLEVLGRHLFQSPSEKGGILAQNFGFVDNNQSYICQESMLVHIRVSVAQIQNVDAKSRFCSCKNEAWMWDWVGSSCSPLSKTFLPPFGWDSSQPSNCKLRTRTRNESLRNLCRFSSPLKS